MLELYNFPQSTCSQKVRLVLAEKGLEWKDHRLDAARGEHLTPEYLALNPNGVVPTLIHDGDPIIDSSVINEYLDDEYPEPPMLPPVGSSAMRSRARLFEDFADTSFTPPVGQLIAEISKPEGERDQNRVQRLHQSVERVLDYLNHELQGNNFLAGEFSVADIGFAPRMLVLNEIGIDVLGNNRGNIDAWIKRMTERPSIRNLQGVAAVPVAGS